MSMGGGCCCSGGDYWGRRWICWYKYITQICIARTSDTQTNIYYAHTLSYNIYSFLHRSESRSQHNSLSTVYNLEPSQSVPQIYLRTLVLFRICALMQHYYTTYTQYDVLLYLTLMQYICSVLWNTVVYSLFLYIVVIGNGPHYLTITLV